MHLPTFIFEFFISLNNQENKSLKRIFEGNFSDIKRFTVLTQKFVENDETLIKKILPDFVEYLKDKAHQNFLLSIKKENIKKELNVLYQNLEKYPGPFYERLIEHKEKELSILSISSLKHASSSIFDEFLSENENIRINQNTLTSDNYFYTNALDILYKKFNSDRAANKKYKKANKDNLYKYYKSLDINLKETDPQFNKYDLLSINSSDEIISGLPSRVFDKKNNVQFMIDIPEHLLNIFKSLIDASVIKNISFLVNSEVIFETNEQYFILLGNHQSEKPITLTDFLNDNRDSSVTKHIIKEPESRDVFPAYISAGRFVENNDSAWYFIDNSNICLEEIVNDVKMLDDCVVTQLIHIMYYTASNKIYLSHIDHEYIFYSYDEFDKRQKNFYQKGSARKRIKTFKIDNSDIPLITSENILLLNTILECYFIKPYLLNSFIRDITGKTNKHL